MSSHSRLLFSLPPVVAIVEVEDEVPIERTDAEALGDVAVEEVVPLVVVVADEEVAPLVFVVAGRKILHTFGWCSLLVFAIVSEYRKTQF